MSLHADDTSLLRAWRRGHEASARLLHARMAPALLAHAEAILRDRALAEDAVQNAFCTLMTLPAREVRRVREVRPWMATLVRREALMMLRSRRRAARRETAHPPAAPDRAPAGADLDDLLGTLPRGVREIIVLRHVAEMRSTRSPWRSGRTGTAWRRGTAGGWRRCGGGRPRPSRTRRRS